MAEGHRNPLLSILNFIVMLVAVMAAVWLLRTFVVTPYQVPSGSMETTIMVQDHVFSERVSYYLRDPQAGEVVTFDDPERPGRTLVKRIIATGGDTVDLEGGTVYVNGLPQQEPYTNGLPSEPLTPAAGVTIAYPYTVPEGCVWVMGDNRTNSADSRYFGAVPATSISGHVIFTYWPLDRAGALN
ncbi:signal peptidase I [Curtanaerobium respiraculi]|uniref:signal peptidase I n=1 Tax=Curtanaerobium respiraculi TaxID=2949669 RepID=UPI0024B39202|nr:signal peptidase I [Curtanaerobium respiraculi]